MTDHIVKAEVIPYIDECVGMFLDWESGRVSAYSVPDVQAAIAEIKRLGIGANVSWKKPQAVFRDA